MGQFTISEGVAVAVLTPVPAEEVPSNYEEALNLMTELRRNEQVAATLEANLTAQATLLYEEHLPAIVAQQEAVERITHRLFAFARAHRAELTNNGETKTIQFGAVGKISWRNQAERLEVEDEKAAIADLEARGLASEYLVVEEVKNLATSALKANPEIIKTIPGMRLVRDPEVCYVETTDPLKGVKANVKKQREQATKPAKVPVGAGSSEDPMVTDSLRRRKPR